MQRVSPLIVGDGRELCCEASTKEFTTCVNDLGDDDDDET